MWVNMCIGPALSGSNPSSLTLKIFLHPLPHNPLSVEERGLIMKSHIGMSVQIHFQLKYNYIISFSRSFFQLFPVTLFPVSSMTSPKSQIYSLFMITKHTDTHTHMFICLCTPMYKPNMLSLFLCIVSDQLASQK